MEAQNRESDDDEPGAHAANPEDDDTNMSEYRRYSRLQANTVTVTGTWSEVSRGLGQPNYESVL